MKHPTNYDYTSSESEAERPRKRARLAPESHEPSFRQILLEEIDLEVALRQRLASTIESRITWALLLQETLTRELNPPEKDTEFRDAALDALEAIEAPCQPLFTRDVRQIRALPSSTLVPATATPTSSAEPVQATSSSTYATRNRGTHRAPRAVPKKLLFIRNTSIYPPQLAKLACPDCSRTDFSSLQGLLNHCRLSHKREFGSHDDCVQSSAILVENPEDQAHIVANGTEVAGITIPGLRRLFELAVKGDRELLPLLPSKKSELPAVSATDATEAAAAATSEPTAEPSANSTGLATRTLGYHADTPALAPLLGKEPKRRVINTHDEDAPVDIFDGYAGSQKRVRWRMAYTHRNKARAELDEIVEPAQLMAELPAEESPPLEKQLSSTSTVPGPGQFSRFHMMARISIKDSSRWTPPDRRLKTREDYTHKWRLQVSSPSYSRPLSTVLSKLIITSAIDPPPSCLSQPIVLDAPPFVITETSNAAFLARLKFHWAGGDELNPPLEVDHWVELDPVNTGYVVPGEEQVFDVGLDRNTKMLPAVEEPSKVSWDLLEEQQYEAQKQGVVPDEDTNEQLDGQSDYVVRLRALVPQFPSTQKDTKDRLSREVRYTLVATPAQFRHLVLGRRKAIEWARANALREAYEQLCVSDPWEDGRSDIPLTTGDVFRWLEDEGHFLRKAQQRTVQPIPHHQRAKRTVIKAEERPADDYCRFCGLHYSIHPGPNVTESQQSAGVGLDGVKLEPIMTSIPTTSAISTSVCTAFNCTSVELPVLDVNRLTCASTHMSEPAPDSLHHSLVALRPHDENFAKPRPDVRYRDLAGTANPALVRAIQELGRKWKVDCLPNADDAVLLPKHRAEADSQAAPVAALALAVRGLARTLIRSGVDEYRRDEAGLRAYGKARQRRGAEGKRLLTPAHVVRGLLHDAPGDRAGSALLLALLPVGMSLPPLEGTPVAPGWAEEDAPDVETAPDP